MESSRSPRRIGMLAFDGVMLLDLSGPAEVFVAANRQVPGAYEIAVLTVGGGAFETSVGARMEAVAVAGSGTFDTVVVVGSTQPALRFVTPELVAATLDLAGRSRRLASICTGAFVLAEAGLLDGRAATTHWKYTRDLAARYPRVSVRHDAIYVRDELTYSSGGASAGIDLALALVEEDHGSEVAQAVARDLLVYLQRGGDQSQFSPSASTKVVESHVVRRVTDHVRAEPQVAHTVRSMAAFAHVSDRQLTRLFRDELGTTPASYVAALRFGIACDWLRAGSSVAAAATAAGFSSGEMMRRVFLARLGRSPRAYRDEVRRREGSFTSGDANRGKPVAPGAGARTAAG
ncbi:MULTISPECIES: GlxA family transcriptional regulator [unclassified Nocardioides]|uniref:GlxA family transcriptional regulator n=1 Tax=unclassified Nocardioides TaxID=2615069 RepID=UPI003015248D